MKEGWKKKKEEYKEWKTQKGVFDKNNEVIKMEDSQKRHKKSSMKRRTRKEKHDETEKGKIHRKTRSKKDILSNAE